MKKKFLQNESERSPKKQIAQYDLRQGTDALERNQSDILNDCFPVYTCAGIRHDREHESYYVAGIAGQFVECSCFISDERPSPADAKVIVTGDSPGQ